MVSVPKYAGENKMEKKITLKTKGMHCASCEKLIEGTLSEIDGVRYAKSSRLEDKTEIVYDEGKVKLETIRAALIELGYTLG